MYLIESSIFLNAACVTKNMSESVNSTAGTIVHESLHVARTYAHRDWVMAIPTVYILFSNVCSMGKF